MTREEAIRIIKIVLVVAENFEITVQGEEFTEEKCKEAVDVAIKALSSSENTPKQSFEDMTNGEVIRTVFSDKDYLIIADRLQHTKWWDASYNGGEQNEADN